MNRTVLLFGLAIVSTLAHANLLVNGSFEQPGSTAFNHFANGQVPGWKTTSTDVIEIGMPTVYGVTGAEGLNVMELDSTRNVAVVQTLTLTAGTYDLSYLYARRGLNLEGKPADTCNFDVLWNDRVIASYVPSSSAMTREHLLVTAIAGTNSVSFRGMGTSDGMGAIIDGTNLAAVPEPVSLFTLVGAALAFIRRKVTSR